MSTNREERRVTEMDDLSPRSEPRGGRESQRFSRGSSSIASSGNSRTSVEAYGEGEVDIEALPAEEAGEVEHQPTTVLDPPRPLDAWDVGALIFSRMVGTGIYTAPPGVLMLIGRNKGVALVLWIFGFAYTLISMALYLEFARMLPYTGGELIYLDESMPGPRLLAYTVYASFFVLLYNNSTNAMQFARQVIFSATHSTKIHDQRLLRFIAVVILTLVCLLHYFHARTGRSVNILLAGIKLCSLLALLIAGTVKAAGKTAGDFTKTQHVPASSYAAAFLLVLFSFEGWENATFVSGEIATHQILRNGFIGAVLLVGTLYLAINMVFFLAIPYADLASQYAPMFFGNTPDANTAWAILIAISACGNMIAITYTCGRVKQSIGWTNIIPWSRVWKKDSPFKPSTPQGGLILHWIFTVVIIAASSAISNLTEAIGFPGTARVYGQSIIGVFVGIGFVLVKRAQIPPPSQRNWTTESKATWLWEYKITKWGIAVLYLFFNCFTLIVPLIPPYKNADGTRREVKGWYYTTTVGVCMIIGGIYYFAIFSRWSVLRLAGAEAEIVTPEFRNGVYGYRGYMKVTAGNPDTARTRFIYWLFGGSQSKYHPHFPNFLSLRDVRNKYKMRRKP